MSTGNHPLRWPSSPSLPSLLHVDPSATLPAPVQPISPEQQQQNPPYGGSFPIPPKTHQPQPGGARHLSPAEKRHLLVTDSAPRGSLPIPMERPHHKLTSRALRGSHSTSKSPGSFEPVGPSYSATPPLLNSGSLNGSNLTASPEMVTQSPWSSGKWRGEAKSP